MADKGPDSLVSGQLVNWVPVYKKILTDLQKGTWKSEDYFWLAARKFGRFGRQGRRTDQSQATPTP